MAYFLFIDESGHDQRDSPYEVLAGVAIKDCDLWGLVRSMQQSELRHFGMRYTLGRRELKATKLLKKKVFRHAAETSLIGEIERRALAKKCLTEGSTAGFREMCALAQAKHAYVLDILNLCGRFRCKAFASIIKGEPQRGTITEHLRKDYVYLFERFFYFIEDTDLVSFGVIVFDELEKAQSHVLLQQMDKYFKHTIKGRERAARIIPEPFFVHSDLTTGIQLADLVAYILSWGFRTRDLSKPTRVELSDMVARLCGLRYRTFRQVGDNPNFEIWSFAVIPDIRNRNEPKRR